MLVGACEFAGPNPFRHIRCEFASTGKPLAGDQDVDPRTLPIPVRGPHPGGRAQLCRKRAARTRTHFGIGKGCGRCAFAGQPQRHREADLVFAAAVVAVELVGLARHLEGRWFGRPAVGALASRQRSRPAHVERLRLGLTRPRGVERLPERRYDRRCRGRGLRPRPAGRESEQQARQPVDANSSKHPILR